MSTERSSVAHRRKSVPMSVSAFSGIKRSFQTCWRDRDRTNNDDRQSVRIAFSFIGGGCLNVFESLATSLASKYQHNGQALIPPFVGISG